MTHCTTLRVRRSKKYVHADAVFDFSNNDGLHFFSLNINMVAHLLGEDIYNRCLRIDYEDILFITVEARPGGLKFVEVEHVAREN